MQSWNGFNTTVDTGQRINPLCKWDQDDLTLPHWLPVMALSASLVPLAWHDVTRDGLVSAAHSWERVYGKLSVCVCEYVYSCAGEGTRVVAVTVRMYLEECICRWEYPINCICTDVILYRAGILAYFVNSNRHRCILRTFPITKIHNFVPYLTQAQLIWPPISISIFMRIRAFPCINPYVAYLSPPTFVLVSNDFIHIVFFYPFVSLLRYSHILLV